MFFKVMLAILCILYVAQATISCSLQKQINEIRKILCQALQNGLDYFE